MTDSMLERMAWAMFVCENHQASSIQLQNVWPFEKQAFVKKARAALECLLEPTEGMVQATESLPVTKTVNDMLMLAKSHGCEGKWDEGDPPIRQWHRAMIRAALEGK